MSSKSKTTQTQTQNQQFSGSQQYGWFTPPDTADFGALRDFKFQSDPRLPHTYARAAERLHSTYRNPLGAYTTPAVRDAALRTGIEDLAQNEAQAYREEEHGRQALNYARLHDVAHLTQPRLQQTGQSGTQSGSSSGTAVQSQSALPGIIGGVSSALIM